MQRLYVGSLSVFLSWAHANNFDRSQYIYHLDQQKVLKLPANAADTIYDPFNYRYTAGGVANPHQPPRALFGHHKFDHVTIMAVNLAP